MISRNSAKSIADAYHTRFTHWERSPGYGRQQFKLHKDDLYDFLYLHAFDAWICNSFHGLFSDKRALLEFIMQLHTGESIAKGTPQWTWQQRQALGQRVLKDLAEALIKERITNPNFETYGDTDKSAVDKMRSTLELDGYVYTDGTLFVPEETVIEEREEQGLLESMLVEMTLSNIDVVKHHLELSSTHYQESRWDDSISNSRKVLEEILRQSAVRILSARGKPPEPTEQMERPAHVRELLEVEGLLARKERETLGEVYGLLSDTGGHPYIAQKDQARLMRHLSLTFSQFVLLRLRGALREPHAS